MTTENKLWQGFTLLELLLVLFITSFLALIPVIEAPNVESSLAETFFFEDFERLITITQESAIFSGQASRIVVEKGKTTLAFDYVSSQGKKVHFYLPIPKNIKAETNTFITFLGESGTLSKVTQCKFLLVDAKKTVAYQFYLGSGKYSKKESDC